MRNVLSQRAPALSTPNLAPRDAPHPLALLANRFVPMMLHLEINMPLQPHCRPRFLECRNTIQACRVIAQASDSTTLGPPIANRAGTVPSHNA
jgi:hypothetical protein